MADLALPDDLEEAAEVLPAPWQEFRSAPLTPIAGGVIVGILLDHTFSIESLVSISIGLTVLIAAFFLISPRVRLVGLVAGSAAVAASYHQVYRHDYPADDIATLLTDGPSLLRVRCILEEDPRHRPVIRDDPLAPLYQRIQDVMLIETSQVQLENGSWADISGLVLLTVERLEESTDPELSQTFRAGDEVEFLGRFYLAEGPANPGERSYRDWLDTRRIRAEAHVQGASVLTRLNAAQPFDRLLPTLRRTLTNRLRDRIPAAELPMARALILGDGQAMRRAEWEIYIRTGVVHTLVISGQHLGILAVFLWSLLLIFDVPRARGAWIVLAVIAGYVVLTGLRPSGVRAAVMVAAFCGAIVLKRRTHQANAFALAIIVVLMLNPTDLFNLGCQLSFLAVFVILWGIQYWFRNQQLTPLERLIDESRPIWWRTLRGAGRLIWLSYVYHLIISFANLPLLLHDQNLIPLGGLIIGPPVVVLTSFALIAGFLLLPICLVAAPLDYPLILLVEWSLRLCNWLVGSADRLPFSSVSMPSPPGWWTALFYLLLIVLILRGVRLRVWLASLLAFAMMGLFWPTSQLASDELRITVLSVGKGNCVVLECPDGRCLVYDVGSARGPTTVPRAVAPYLWHRGIARIDELFLSHADTDHFNGIAQFVRRFPIGQITLTPSFADKPTVEVAAALFTMEQAKIPRRLTSRGDRFRAGEVELEVLHPPLVGPPGIENERSLVLRVKYAGFSVLFTGDLEKAGTSTLLELPSERVDVLLAPHHGSRPALPLSLLRWCQPRFIVVSRGQPYANSIRQGPDTNQILTWDTESKGAVTIRCHRSGIVAESFRTGDRQVIARSR